LKIEIFAVPKHICNKGALPVMKASMKSFLPLALVVAHVPTRAEAGVICPLVGNYTQNYDGSQKYVEFNGMFFTSSDEEHPEHGGHLTVTIDGIIHADWTTDVGSFQSNLHCTVINWGPEAATWTRN
jgi:hypothetical protein